MDRVWLGLEIGTQGVRAAAFDDGGAPLSMGRARRPPRSPAPGAMIHLPDIDWWEGAREALAGALSSIEVERVAGIGLAGLFPAVCLAAADGRALSEGVLYGDRRAVAANDDVTPHLMRLLGSIAEETRHDAMAIGPAGYLGLRLTGRPSIDPHSASRWEGLRAASGRQWDLHAAAGLGIPARMLPPIVAPGTVLGQISATAAGATSLPAGAPVISATTDSLATMLGAGVLRTGDAVANYGSTGTLLLVTMDLEQALAEPDADGAATPYRRVAHATGSGLLAEFVRQELFGGAEHAGLDAEAATVPVGSEGVMVVPYLAGRQLPRPAPGLRAGIHGIGVGHRRGHLWRAVLEAYGWILMEAQQDPGTGANAVQRVTAAGGGSRSAVWRAIVSDMTGWRQAVARPDATVRGAAFLAARALSGSSFSDLAQLWFQQPPAGRAGATWAGTAVPDQASTEHYRTLLPAWTRLVEALATSGDAAR